LEFSNSNQKLEVQTTGGGETKRWWQDTKKERGDALARISKQPAGLIRVGFLQLQILAGSSKQPTIAREAP
jgi:hypothetical protein